MSNRRTGLNNYVCYFRVSSINGHIFRSVIDYIEDVVTYYSFRVSLAFVALSPRWASQDNGTPVGQMVGRSRLLLQRDVNSLTGNTVFKNRLRKRQ